MDTLQAAANTAGRAEYRVLVQRSTTCPTDMADRWTLTPPTEYRGIMRSDVLSRHERDPNQTILIDVAAGSVGDLNNDFDRSAPYIRRDLDQDLVDYLIECARELENEPNAIPFTLTNPPDAGGL